MTTLKLIAKQVTVGSEAKFFGLDRGASDGSSVSITFEIPEGMDEKELKRAMLVEKERLDMFVLVAERIKESMPDNVFQQRKAALKSQYDKLLGRGGSKAE